MKNKIFIYAIWVAILAGLIVFINGVFFQENFINPFMLSGFVVLIMGILFLIFQVEEN